METTLIKSQAIVEGDVNMKYHIVHIGDGTRIGTGNIRYKYYAYADKYGKAPIIHVISYNGEVSMSPVYGTVTLEKTETIGEDTVRHYIIDGTSHKTMGVYGIRHDTSTKLMIEDIEGCSLLVKGNYPPSPLNYLDKDDYKLHYNRMIVSPDGWSFLDEEDVYGLGNRFYWGMCATNGIGSTHVTIGTKPYHISDFFGIMPYAAYFRMYNSPIYGNIADMADYICIDGYKPMRKKCFHFDITLERTNLTGRLEQLLQRLKARGARNFFLTTYFENQDFGVPNNVATGYYFDTNGNYITVPFNDFGTYLGTWQHLSTTFTVSQNTYKSTWPGWEHAVDGTVYNKTYNAEDLVFTEGSICRIRLVNPARVWCIILFILDSSGNLVKDVLGEVYNNNPITFEMPNVSNASKIRIFVRQDTGYYQGEPILEMVK